jgi:pimeloyl-ACP methyl ester carboxylesterase
MRMQTLASLAVATLTASSSVFGQSPRAVSADPPRDAAHPARMEVLHIPSGGVNINGVAYLASGEGAHPTVVLFHGLPGNEKNLDLAQAVRRAGWNAVTVNYRGSWGSPGEFRFGGNLEDANAVLAFVRDAANARRLGIDPQRVVVAGHSMGGWVTAFTAAHHPELLGAVLISSADMGLVGTMPRDKLTDFMADNMESLSDVTAQGMADELIGGTSRWRFAEAASGLARLPLLALTSDDGLAPHTDSLVQRVRALGNTRVTVVHEPTDHYRMRLLQFPTVRYRPSIRFTSSDIWPVSSQRTSEIGTRPTALNSSMKRFIVNASPSWRRRSAISLSVSIVPIR